MAQLLTQEKVRSEHGKNIKLRWKTRRHVTSLRDVIRKQTGSKRLWVYMYMYCFYSSLVTQQTMA